MIVHMPACHTVLHTHILPYVHTYTQYKQTLHLYTLTANVHMQQILCIQHLSVHMLTIPGWTAETTTPLPFNRLCRAAPIITCT